MTTETERPLGLGLSEGLGAASEARCMCKDRVLSACPGEWEQGCDLGSNPAHVCVHRECAACVTPTVCTRDQRCLVAPW